MADFGIGRVREPDTNLERPALIVYWSNPAVRLAHAATLMLQSNKSAEFTYATLSGMRVALEFDSLTQRVSVSVQAPGLNEHGRFRVQDVANFERWDGLIREQGGCLFYGPERTQERGVAAYDEDVMCLVWCTNVTLSEL